MPNFSRHWKTGVFVCGSAAMVTDFFLQLNRIKKGQQERFNWMELFGYTAVGAGVGVIGGVLPDLLEPATTPNHREFFHSVVLGIAICGSLIAVRNSPISAEDKLVLLSLGLGYLTHLALDGGTPNGLPFI